MVTKWKNLKNRIKKAKEFIVRHKKFTAGAILLFIGALYFRDVVVYRSYHDTRETMNLSIVGNLVWGAGMFICLKEVLKHRYKEWNMDDISFFEKWKAEKKKQNIILFVTGIVMLCMSVLYFLYLLWGGIYNSAGGWYMNYASGYLMIITVLVQYLVARAVITQFMNEKIEQLVEKTAKISEKKLKDALDEALEIERKSLEKVSRSDQLRIELITNVSHDLKTPLTSIVGYLELIKKEELSDVVRDYVDVISMRAEKLKEMINSLFSLAKASSGNVELHPEELELNRLLEQILADLKDKVDDSGLHFILQLTKEDTKFISDNMYCYRICQNLIENALKYSAKGTRVFLKTYIKDQWLHMDITNTAGYFMDFEKEDIMERFARGDKERTSEGNGLGLAIVSSYAKALSGEFDIYVDCDQFKACLKLPKEIKDQ